MLMVGPKVGEGGCKHITSLSGGLDRTPVRLVLFGGGGGGGVLVLVGGVGLGLGGRGLALLLALLLVVGGRRGRVVGELERTDRHERVHDLLRHLSGKTTFALLFRVEGKNLLNDRCCCWL